MVDARQIPPGLHALAARLREAGCDERPGLPVNLLDLWAGSVPGRSRLAVWAAQQRRAGGLLSIGWPGRGADRVDALLGRRLWLLAPAAWPLKTVAVLSSHPGRDRSRHEAAAAAVRVAAEQVRCRPAFWLLATGTAAYGLADAAAAWLEAPRVVVQVADQGGLARWLARLPKALPPAGPHGIDVVGSPPLVEPRGDEGWRGIRGADRVLAAAADELFVAYVRPGGRISRLLQWRAAAVGETAGGRGAAGGGGAAAAVDPPTAPAEMQPPVAADGRPASGPGSGCGRGAVYRPGPLLPTRLSGFLLHWTRAAVGPWPGETRREYWRRVLHRHADSASPLASLRRILTLRRLTASGRMIRGGTPVVSFTSMSLPRLMRHRQFRRHRRAWDAEPYGLAIDRQWLIDRGALPVIYAQAAVWGGLEPADRPWFQRRFSRPASSQPIDWSIEREWRLVGDLDLEGLDARSCFVFVPSIAEARALRPISPWPLLPLDLLRSPTPP